MKVDWILLPCKPPTSWRPAPPGSHHAPEPGIVWEHWTATLPTRAVTDDGGGRKGVPDALGALVTSPLRAALAEEWAAQAEWTRDFRKRRQPVEGLHESDAGVKPRWPDPLPGELCRPTRSRPRQTRPGFSVPGGAGIGPS